MDAVAWGIAITAWGNGIAKWIKFVVTWVKGVATCWMGHQLTGLLCDIIG